MLIGNVISVNPVEGTLGMLEDKSQRAEVRVGRREAVMVMKVGLDFMIYDYFKENLEFLLKG